MKIIPISAAILLALSSNQVIADDVSGNARFNLQKAELIVPCVLVNDPGGPLDGKFFDARFNQRGKSLNFEVSIADEELDAEACLAAAQALLEGDEDTTDDGDDSSEDDESTDDPSEDEETTEDDLSGDESSEKNSDDTTDDDSTG